MALRQSGAMSGSMTTKNRTQGQNQFNTIQFNTNGPPTRCSDGSRLSMQTTFQSPKPQNQVGTVGLSQQFHQFIGDANHGVTRNGKLGGASSSMNQNYSKGNSNQQLQIRNVMTSVAKKRTRYNGPRQKPQLQLDQVNCQSQMSGAFQIRGQLQSQIQQRGVVESLFAQDPVRGQLQDAANGAYEARLLQRIAVRKDQKAKYFKHSYNFTPTIKGSSVCMNDSFMEENVMLPLMSPGPGQAGRNSRMVTQGAFKPLVAQSLRQSRAGPRGKMAMNNLAQSQANPLSASPSRKGVLIDTNSKTKPNWNPTLNSPKKMLPKIQVDNGFTEEDDDLVQTHWESEEIAWQNGDVEDKIVTYHQSDILNQIMTIANKSTEPSVVPGAFRSKNDIMDRHKKHLTTQSSVGEGMTKEEKKMEQQRARVIAQQAKMSFMEMKEGLKRLRQAQEMKAWKDARRFEKGLKDELDAFRESCVKISVSRKRDIEKLYAARCRVNSDRNGLSEAAAVKAHIGNNGMLSGENRELCKAILQMKGVIKLQTLPEKYQKVFAKYTLSPEQLAQREADLIAKRQAAVDEKNRKWKRDLIERNNLQVNEDSIVNELGEESTIQETIANVAGSGGQIYEELSLDEQPEITFTAQTTNRTTKFLDKPIPRGKQNPQTERYNRDGLREPSQISGGISILNKDEIFLAHTQDTSRVSQNITEEPTQIGAQQLRLETTSSQLEQPSVALHAVQDRNMFTPQSQTNMIFSSYNTRDSRERRINAANFDNKFQGNRQKYLEIQKYGNNHYRTGQQRKKIRAFEEDAAKRYSPRGGGNSPHRHRGATSELGGNSSDIGSLGEMEARLSLKRYENIRQEDKDALLAMFEDLANDPDWYDESVLFGLLSKRIPAAEFMDLLTADPQWTHMAGKKHTEKVIELFDKVYGYTKGLSRLEEQNKRYQKRLQNVNDAGNGCKLSHTHNDECKQKAEEDKKNKQVLNEIFDVSGFLADTNMVERYSEYLNKILINSQDRFIQAMHQRWKSQGREEEKQLSFYERMKIDEMMRDRKKEQAVSNVSAAETTKPAEESQSEGDEESVGSQEEDEERAQEKQARAMAKSLNVSVEQAKVIAQMTASKGIRSKTLDGGTKDEALLLTPLIAARAAEAARQAHERGEPATAKIILELPDAEDEATQEDSIDPPSNNSRKRIVKTKKVQFNLGSLEAAPAKYMLGQAGDQDFDDWLISEMARYLKAKLKHGKNLSIRRHVPGFKPYTAKTQFEYKLKKRLNDKERHGCELLKQKLGKSKQPFVFRKRNPNNKLESMRTSRRQSLE